jgi:hypothetical protein
MSDFRFFIFTSLFVFFLSLPLKQGAFPKENSLLAAQKESINRLVLNKQMEDKNAVVIDAFMEKFMQQNQLKGVSLAIVKDEKLVFAKGYGFANEEAQIQVNPNHLFRLASVSKLITAVAIMKLVENSKISLESKVFGKDGINNFLISKINGSGKLPFATCLTIQVAGPNTMVTLPFFPRQLPKVPASHFLLISIPILNL